MTSVWVVPALDKREDCHASFSMALKSTPIEQLTFQRGEKALAHRIVIAISNRPHRDSDLPLMTPIAKGHRGVWRALVRVMNHLARTTLTTRHIQGIQDQLGTHMMGHRPPHYTAAKDIEHHRQIEKPDERGDIRDIGDP